MLLQRPEPEPERALDPVSNGGNLSSGLAQRMEPMFWGSVVDSLRLLQCEAIPALQPRT